MISWTFARTLETIQGQSWPEMHDVMTNQAGVAIEPWGISLRNGHVSFHYTDGDIKFDFWAKALRDNGPGNQSLLRAQALGPTCRVTILSSQLTRPLSEEEGKIAAENICSCLLQAHRFPIARAPFPAEVVFDKFSKESLKLGL